MNTPKTETVAVLVDYAIRTRVIVELPIGADPNHDDHFETIAKAAQNKIKAYVQTDAHYPYPDDIVEIELDEEVPFDPEHDTNTVVSHRVE